MSIGVLSNIDFSNTMRAVNYPDAINPQEPVTKAQLDNAVANLPQVFSFDFGTIPSPSKITLDMGVL